MPQLGVLELAVIAVVFVAAIAVFVGQHRQAPSSGRGWFPAALVGGLSSRLPTDVVVLYVVPAIVVAALISAVASRRRPPA